MTNREEFILKEMATLEADYDRYQRMLEQIAALTERDRKRILRQQAEVRRAWLDYQQALEEHRKANPPAKGLRLVKGGKPTVH